jgi:putative ABC transport system permease protein
MLGIQNLKVALYSLSKAKGYSLSIVLSLGITLGALVAMFNLNYQILAAPLPYPDADRLFIAKPNIYVDGHLKYSGIMPVC